MKKEINVPVIAISAAAGSGKTKLLEALRLATEDDPRILIMDTSAVISWHREHGTKFGAVFQGLQRKQAERELMPDKPTILAGLQRIEHHRKEHPELLAVYWAGSPRRRRQSELMWKGVYKLRLVTIECNLKEALEGDATRPERIDSGLNKTRRAWQMHQDLGLPAVEYLIHRRGIPHLPLERRQLMGYKIKSLIEFGQLGDDLTKLLTDRCASEHHPAGQLIHKLDGTHSAKPAHIEQRPCDPPQGDVRNCVITHPVERRPSMVGAQFAF